ncbi:hypothetical protein [Mangrovihabitans endophyticus]|uniref:Uncharacterized protein n=1 Tax=Mangrovihabitans endophyticus TaxID=1751298 RepID=A0A8J3FK52_9ACTN|nr:hypothetical protein [Mangrovihabitans endophyticus]GGK71042.1 hypothetical protein GCM10012284_01010 [Mangrovihabitans endophyticus]
MSTSPRGFVAGVCATVRAAADLVTGVERALHPDGRIVTARGNAWDAVQANRARARARDDMDQFVRALLVSGPGHARGGDGQVSVGSSPRSSASQAALVSTGPADGRDTRAPAA